MTTNERGTIRRLNRRLADEGRFITVSRPGESARFLLRDSHTGNLEAWADSLDGWVREMEVES